jgi:hypothetical protein
MFRLVWLFALLLAVPLFGFGVSQAIRSHLDSELQTAAHQEYPKASEEQLSKVTVDRLCEDLLDDELCSTNSNLNLMSEASLGAGVVGVSLLLLISLAGTIARNSRSLLVFVFTPGLYLTAFIVIGLVLVHATVAMAAIYYGESVLIGRIHVGIILAIGLGAAVGVLTISRGLLSLVRKAETLVIGKSLTQEQAPHLWALVEASARQLSALQPDDLPPWNVPISRVRIWDTTRG